MVLCLYFFGIAIFVACGFLNSSWWWQTFSVWCANTKDSKKIKLKKPAPSGVLQSQLNPCAKPVFFQDCLLHAFCICSLLEKIAQSISESHMVEHWWNDILPWTSYHWGRLVGHGGIPCSNAVLVKLFVLIVMVVRDCPLGMHICQLIFSIPVANSVLSDNFFSIFF